MGIFGGTPQDQVDLDDLKARVARLEAAVASLQSQSAGLDASAPAADVAWMTEVQALVNQRQKIQAIKLYRERTGVGLAQAKDAVDRMG